MNTSHSKLALVDRVVETLHSNLPAGLKVQISGATLEISSSDQNLAFAIDLREKISSASQARLGLGVDLPVGDNSLLISRYIPKPLRAKLRGFGVNFADASGAINIQRRNPFFVVSVDGSGGDTARPVGRPVASLKGVPASKVARVLLDFETPIDVADVIRFSGASRGSVYRALDYLQQVGLIERTERGRVNSCDWPSLLELWSESYGLQSSNTVRSFIAPRGLEAVISDLSNVGDLDYALTGTFAAAHFEAYAVGFTAVVYTPQVDELANRLRIRENPEGGNVLLIEPNGDFQLQNTTLINGVKVAAVSQIAVDLLTGPGRNPEEGKALVRWMKGRNDWRLKVGDRVSKSAY